LVEPIGWSVFGKKNLGGKFFGKGVLNFPKGFPGPEEQGLEFDYESMVELSGEKIGRKNLRRSAPP
jgi:hypothetical protein